MKYSISWNEGDLAPIISIVGASICFILYWFTYSSEKVKQYFYSRYPNDNGKIYHILFVKYMALVTFVILPGILFYFLLPEYSLSDFGLTFSRGTTLISLQWIAALGILILIMNWFAARRAKTFRMYPQIRVKEWDARLILTYCLAWSAYLFGYELLFRGFLLFPLVDSIGIWPAIAVNIALYSVSHIPKGMDETIGALPFGIVLCLITLQTETIWASFVIHVALVLSNSLVALMFHPEMRIVKVRNTSTL